MKHKITVEADARGNGRYTYSYLCSCGAKEYGHHSRAGAQRAGNEHQAEEAARNR